MPLSETIEALKQLVEASSQLDWTAENSFRVVLGTNSITVAMLVSLREEGCVPSVVQDRNLQDQIDSDASGPVPVGTTISFMAPRQARGLIVVKGLNEFLRIDAVQVSEPDGYLLIPSTDTTQLVSHVKGDSLDLLPQEMQRYHQAIQLRQTLIKQSQFRSSSESLFFFGTRKVEIAPGFAPDDLRQPIASTEIRAFIGGEGQNEISGAIFTSVILEFLRDQSESNAFAYLLRNSYPFLKRLKEGLAIYLAEHSPEKLEEEARTSSLEFSEKLEKIVSGLEVKSLSIPAAVLLAVKEIEPAEGPSLVNIITASSAAAYGLTMLLVFFSHKALFSVLLATIRAKEDELRSKGLDQGNTVLVEAFRTLKSRLRWSRVGSRTMALISWAPLVCVILAMAFGGPSKPINVTVNTASDGTNDAPSQYNISVPATLNPKETQSAQTNAPGMYTRPATTPHSIRSGKKPLGK